MNMHACGKLNGRNDLVSLIRQTCDKHNVSFLKYVFNKNYASYTQRKIFRMSHDGLSDFMYGYFTIVLFILKALYCYYYYYSSNW